MVTSDTLSIGRRIVVYTLARQKDSLHPETVEGDAFVPIEMHMILSAVKVRYQSKEWEIYNRQTQVQMEVLSY
jgi:hypothetical protein